MLDRRAVSMTRIPMTRSKIGGRLAAFVMAALLAGGVAWAGLVGVITDVSKRSITVSGAVYDIDQNTSIEDMSGQKITLPELRPGVSVELEFDDEGHLTTIRAAVVR
jgi:uncharacterized protein DUF5666